MSRLTPQELVERLCADRRCTTAHYERQKEDREYHYDKRLTIDDLIIIRDLGNKTMDGWDMEISA